MEMKMEKKPEAKMEDEKEEYGSPAARAIAAASGVLAMAILCCGDVTVASLRRGIHYLKAHTYANSNHNNARVPPLLTAAIHWVNKLATLVEEIAILIMSWVVNPTRYVGGLILNSKPVNTILINQLLPAEIVLATLHSFNKIWDAVDVSRKNVMSTLSGATTDLISHRYGENAGRATEQVLQAAAHTVGATTVVSTAINPKNTVASTSSLAEAATTTSHNLHKKDT